MQPGNLRHTHTQRRERGGLKKKKRKEEGFDSRRRRLSWCDVCAIGFHSTFAPHCPARLCAPSPQSGNNWLSTNKITTDKRVDPRLRDYSADVQDSIFLPGGTAASSAACAQSTVFRGVRWTRMRFLPPSLPLPPLCVEEVAFGTRTQGGLMPPANRKKEKKKNPSISGLFFPCSFRGSAYYKTGSVSRAKKTLRPNPQSPASLFIPFPLPPNFMTLIITNDKRTRNPREEEEIDFKSGDIQLRRKNRSGASLC